MTWQEFVIAHGWHARKDHLAHVLGMAAADVERFRRSASGTCARLPKALGFVELFTRWHGRPPADDEWPAPQHDGGRVGAYEWQQPELALLATLVGTMSVRDITGLLTDRLRRLTGNPEAERSTNAVQTAINHLGLQSGSDLLGGITTGEAARIVGRVSLINQAIHNQHLRTLRVGRRHVIPRAEFERWLSTRETPPDGWVRLASLRVPLGIESDKLPEYARLGFIPDVRLVKGIGTARGVWFIHPDTAARILEDAAAGRPMPWHGKPLPGNMRAMWRKWQARKHRRCATCAAIWRTSEPTTFEAFSARYGELTLGEKRHLTLDRSRVHNGSAGWRPRGSVRQAMQDAGVTVYEAAAQLQQRSRWVRMWIRRGLLERGGVVRDAKGGEALRITPLGLEMLRAAAADEAAQLTDRYEGIGVHDAAQLAGVCITTIHLWRRNGEVIARPGPRGLLFDRASLEARAREYWAWAMKRYRRARPPAWLQDGTAA